MLFNICIVKMLIYNGKLLFVYHYLATLAPEEIKTIASKISQGCNLLHGRPRKFFLEIGIFESALYYM